ncbi:glycogen debranching protein GlgX [Aquabacterium sp. A7-Y]|uniref:glycogen debranching protein GlgX n=1 Tax=Aquabacterium sp. A7-Y TaxID=1349605 RepID=UPI00223E8B69|nr:glycogen debranching protein GlgX [Aquabacterium sp. A7-Y]MCW7537846.1 glycogen debranching protein GlgX [Aquabacterium sp. A7-Y]
MNPTRHDERIGIVWPGRPYPFGATWDGEGVNFAVFSEHAESVELCLFDADGRRELQRIPLRERSDDIWHCYLPEARPGLAYGFRVHGPYRPEDGHRFNPHKLLVDPYAKDLVGELRWSDALYGYTIGHKKEDLSLDRRDSAPFMPKARVLETAFTWGDDRRPEVPWADMVIYELHVRGFTKTHPRVPPRLQGTYAAMACAPVIDHLQRLGVTTVELMPTHSFIDERSLAEKGLHNYWGYNTLGFFAPQMRYSASRKVKEFKTMVKALHSAGIEVLLDVVYNHSCEGNHLGPTLSFRGLDNGSYYKPVPEDRRYYADFTGCGNTLNLVHPRVLQLVMDSLRYWVEEMHVDGFRFDLAPALARARGKVEHLSGFFTAICQDPVLNRVKLVAEPWDLGQDGYQVGRFPAGWAEWNDRYRDGMRAYWKGDRGLIGEVARRVTGSSDLYESAGKRPHASINFVTAHDGFTLHDLVSYNNKHNHANGEDNRDGTDHNRSWNCGVEGPTEDAGIRQLRERQKRNFLTTVLLSQGVPMLLAGDEFGHSQDGNNNAYCQDNALSWIDWRETPERRALLGFVQRVVALRRGHRTFRRRGFFVGQSREGDFKDLVWLTPDGREMTEADWSDAEARCFGMCIFGAGIPDVDGRGEPIRDDDFLVMFNAHHDDVHFVMPPLPGASWQALLDTRYETGEPPPTLYPQGKTYALCGRSMAALTRSASLAQGLPPAPPTEGGADDV